MNNRKFDRVELAHALAQAEINPPLAKEMMKNYLEKYPNQYSTYALYSGLLITLNEIEEAERILSCVENMKYDSNFSKKKNLLSNLKSNIIYDKLRIHMHKGEYDKALKLAVENEALINKNNQRDVETCIVFCRKKLGLPNLDYVSYGRYLYDQIIDYDIDKFLKHLEKHEADYTNTKPEESSIFLPDFELEKIVQEVKKNMHTENMYSTGLIIRKYIFKYDNCGRVKAKNADYFMVASLITDELISMYPITYGKNCKYVDLNYLKTYKEEPKVKRLSQIDKFNQKYGIK